MAFVPSHPPDNSPLARWLFDEFRRLSEEINTQQERLRVAELNAAPSKPRDGDIVYADGTNWNPGSGEGFYGRSAGAWSKF